MLQAEIYKNHEHGENFVSSKKINLTDSSLAIIQISSTSAQLGSFIESTVIDLIITNIRATSTDVYADFWYLLEKLNKYFKEIAKKEDLSNLNIFLGVIEASTLHFSVLGKTYVHLVKNEKILNIAEWMGSQSETSQFSYTSSGTINQNDSIHISNIDILDSLTGDDIIEITHYIEASEKVSIIENLLEREVSGKYIHLIILSNPEVEWRTRTVSPFYGEILQKWFRKIGILGQDFSQKILENESIQEILKKAKDLLNTKNKIVRSGLFGIGILLCVGLLYALLSSLFSQKINTTVPEEYKNKLIEAQLIIEKANKDLGNRDIFNGNIKKAEDIIFEVRKKQIWLNDVKKLLADISILKKQMNGIESFDARNAASEYLFTEKDFNIESIFEISKKLYFVGKTSLIGPYIKWGEVKTFTYPDAEEAISSDATNEGYIYIFTKTGRLLRFYKGEFSYVNVEGQKTWEKWSTIHLYNSNLYILSDDGKQIFKHKPGLNGFSSKTEVLQNAQGSDLKNHTILDFGVDGGFYLVKDDISIDKVFGLPTYSKRSIVINNLPENYKLDGGSVPEFLTAPNLNYLYMILNNHIWIFEPNTKNYKDVTSIKYIGQVEFVEDQVRSLLVPKDGNIIAWTDRGIYTINFEVSDGKVTVR